MAEAAEQERLDKITCVTVVEEIPKSAIVQTLENKTDSNGSIENEEVTEPVALDDIECKIEEAGNVEE